MPDEETAELIARTLEEDYALKDITSELVIPPEMTIRAAIIAGQEAVVCGGDISRRVFLAVDSEIKYRALCLDGATVQRGERVAEISGRARSILRSERTALNFLGLLSGIATRTAQFVEAVRPTGAVICDTRKTAPGLRTLEKYAVKTGGGRNHRMNMADGILIKDNHLNALKAAGMSIGEVVRKAKRQANGLETEVEVNTVKEAMEALEAGADIIMLDNMSPAQIKQAVEQISGRARLEASGGVTLSNVRQIAKTGVDYISIGALTHSVANADFSLEII